jgi:hypothetical protein
MHRSFHYNAFISTFFHSSHLALTRTFLIKFGFERRLVNYVIQLATRGRLRNANQHLKRHLDIDRGSNCSNNMLTSPGDEESSFF